MPRTFGGTTSDRLTFSAGVTVQDTLVFGWWYPTTLTATRTLWTIGSIFGAEINSVTDELRLKVDGATTDGEWTTTGVDMAVNNWYFLAFLHSQTSTPAAAWRVWRGTLETEPVECTVTQAVAPVGAITTGSTINIGNRGTGTLAFQGSIASVGFIVTNITTVAESPFHIATQGAISDAEAEFSFRNYVQHAWQARYWWLPAKSVKGSSTSTGTGIAKGLVELAGSSIEPVWLVSFAAGATIPITWTGNGGAISTIPHPCRTSGPPVPDFIRRPV